MFEEILGSVKDSNDYHADTDLTADDWKQVVRDYKRAVEREYGKPFPSDPKEQLWGAVGAVFASWMNDRAIVYRRTYGIPHEWGTAVNVQAMVFGNLGDDCATGVAMTRDVALGMPGINGDYLIYGRTFRLSKDSGPQTIVMLGLAGVIA